MESPIITALRRWKIVPILTLKTQEKALEVARTFVEGGLPVLELTLRYPGADEGLKKIRQEFPHMLVGAGTVLTLDLAKKAKAAGAQFVVSPAFNPDVVKFCLDQEIPVFPGVNNPTHLFQAMELGASYFKIFPVEASGGTALLKALSGPFPTAWFFPTGGLNHTNIGPYLDLPRVIGVGCGDLCPEEALDQGHWPEISRRIALYRQAGGLE